MDNLSVKSVKLLRMNEWVIKNIVIKYVNIVQFSLILHGKVKKIKNSLILNLNIKFLKNL